MSKKKKSGHKKPTLAEYILLATAIIQLTTAVLMLLEHLM